MSYTQEDLQRALRISKAIQEYFHMNYNYNVVRSTDLYEFLAKKGLIETDRHRGFHFRAFLQKLKDNDLLSLIPQCQCSVSPTGSREWRFARMSDEKLETIRNSNKGKQAKITHIPRLPEAEINQLIQLARKFVDELPKRDASNLTQQQRQIRNAYPRAYEEWHSREIEIMTRAYNKFGRVDKVAELLQRQPHIVREKLEEHGVISKDQD